MRRDILVPMIALVIVVVIFMIALWMPIQAKADDRYAHVRGSSSVR